MVSNSRTALLLAGIVLLQADVLDAQSTRTRTLKLDPEGGDWVEVVPPPEGTSEGDLYLIRRANKAGRFRESRAGIKRFIDQYGEADEFYPAVLVERAAAKVGQEDYYAAHLDLQEYLNQSVPGELTDEALRLEFVIADVFLTGVKRKFAGLRILPGRDIAFRIYDDIASQFPDHEFAPLAIKQKADYLFNQAQDFEFAQLEYERLLREHPGSRYAPEARLRIADTALAGFGGVELDEAALIDAEERYRDYLAQYPVTRAAEQIDTILDDIADKHAAKEYTIGRYYERKDHIGSAIFYYRSVVDRWPDTVAAVQARTRLALLAPNAMPLPDEEGS